MGKIGLSAVLYRNTGTYGSPTWTPVNNVGDLTVNDEMDEADVTTRGSGGFEEMEPTLRRVPLEFDMVNKAGDTDLAAIRTAYATRAVLDIVALDGPIATPGSHGVRARYKVFKFTKGQNLKDAQLISVTIKPCSDTNPPSEMTVT